MTHPARRKKSGSSLIASANCPYEKRDQRKNRVGQTEIETYPVLLDHVFHLLYRGVDVVACEVEEDAQ